MLENLINAEMNEITMLKRDIYHLEKKLEGARELLREHQDLLAKLESLKEEP